MSDPQMKTPLLAQRGDCSKPKHEQPDYRPPTDSFRSAGALAQLALEAIGKAGDAVSRWSWTRSYEIAEANYWPEGGE